MLNDAITRLFQMGPSIIVCYFILQSIMNLSFKGIIYLMGLIICMAVLVFLDKIDLSSVYTEDDKKSNKKENISDDDEILQEKIRTGDDGYLLQKQKTGGKKTGNRNKMKGGEDAIPVAEAVIPIVHAVTIKSTNEGSCMSLGISKIPLGVSVYTYTFFYLLIFVLYLGSKDNSGLKSGNMNQDGLSIAVAQNTPILILFPALLVTEIVQQFRNNCITEYAILRTSISFFVSAIVGTTWAIIITYIGDDKLMFLTKNDVDTCSRPSKTYFSCKRVPV